MEETPAREVFTPEDFREEHRMLIKTTEDFVQNEVVPHLEELENKNFEMTRRLMRQAGALGLLGADVPEEYGGGGLGIIAALLVGEHSVAGGSLTVVINAHTGIGTMPLVFFGNKAQKAKYLPGLASGEKIGAYALTEPGAGTDALSMQATAVLSPDGKHYRLNGTKQFITNGGFADVITTYARVGGEKITAFVLERGFPGVSTGPEEKKMGLRGSSTVSVILEDARVPVENVIFEIGKGHTVAFNILDLGRFKLAAACVGVAKLALEQAVKYGKERIQFGKPICQFGLIKHKIAEMAITNLHGREHGLPDRRSDRGGPGERGPDRQRRRPDRAARPSRSTPSSAPSTRSSAPRCWTTSLTRRSRFTAATGTSRNTRWRGSTGTTASSAYSRAPTRSTGSSPSDS